MFSFKADQGCLILLLEGCFPAEFSSNTPEWTFLVILKTLISRFGCVLLELELNLLEDGPLYS